MTEQQQSRAQSLLEEAAATLKGLAGNLPEKVATKVAGAQEHLKLASGKHIDLAEIRRLVHGSDAP